MIAALLLTLTLGSGVAAADEPFPRDWYWGKEAQWQEHQKLIGQPAPKLDLADWANGPVSADDMRGKIVVLDFWATWCGPCRANLPKGNTIMEKYADQGVLMVGVCSSRGQEKMQQVLDEKGVKFPVAKDPRQASSQAWDVKWWPTYAVMDRHGIVRAVGLKPGAIEPMVQMLLEEQPFEEEESADEAPAEQASVHPAWLEGSGADRERLASLQGAAPPALAVEQWSNSEPLALDDLRGKVVLLDFWATWCGPCIRSIPKTNQLMDKYGDEGLVVIGVCHPKGGEKLAETIQSKNIRYPVALDAGGKTIEAYRVDSYPDYYFIDRAGRLRVADCRNGAIENVIRVLLDEEAPTEPEPVAAR